MTQQSMKPAKIVGLVFLSLFLFVSLYVSGLAFALDRTVLDPGFIPAQVDRLDISALVDETAGQAGQTDLPLRVRSALMAAVDGVEPEIKAQYRDANARVYDYVLGRTGEIDLAAIVKDTVLNEAFVASVVDQADVRALVRESLRDQLVELVPLDQQQLVGYLDEAMPSLDPWLQQQVRLVTGPVVDYVLGESQSLKITVSLEPMKAALRASTRQAFLKAPPPELAGATPSQLDAIFSQGFDRFAAGIGSTATVDETTIGLGSPASIARAFSDAETGLAEARSAVSIFRTYYALLLVLILLLIAGIVLVHREVRGAARNLGIIFLVYGAMEYVGILTGRYFIRSALNLTDVPAALRAWLPGLMADFFRPMEILAIVLALAGAALIVVSIVYRRRPAAGQPLGTHD